MFLESISSVRWKGRISLSNDLSWDTDSERERDGDVRAPDRLQNKR